MLASHSNARKIREVLQFALKQKPFEIWVWGFRWVSSERG